MPTVTRKNGTRVTVPATPAERIAAIRTVVAERQYAKIDGAMMDLSSASAIIAVYDKLKPETQAVYAAKPAPIMAAIAFKLMK